MRQPTCFRWVWRHPHPATPALVQCRLMEVDVTRFPCRASVLPLRCARVCRRRRYRVGPVRHRRPARHGDGRTGRQRARRDYHACERQHRVFERDGGGWHWRIPVRCDSAWHLHGDRRVGGLPDGRVRQRPAARGHGCASGREAHCRRAHRERAGRGRDQGHQHDRREPGQRDLGQSGAGAAARGAQRRRPAEPAGRRGVRAHEHARRAGQPRAAR